MIPSPLHPSPPPPTGQPRITSSRQDVPIQHGGGGAAEAVAHELGCVNSGQAAQQCERGSPYIATESASSAITRGTGSCTTRRQRLTQSIALSDIGSGWVKPAIYRHTFFNIHPGHHPATIGTAGTTRGCGNPPPPPHRDLLRRREGRRSRSSSRSRSRRDPSLPVLQ